jgi:SAM-dependent methyltransferase
MRLVFTGERVIPGDPAHRWIFAEHLMRYRFAQSFVPGQRVLDVACGVGYGTALLARAKAEIAVGIDLDPDAIAYAKARYGGIPRTHYVQGDIESLGDVWKRPCDLCVSFETLEHLARPEQFLSGIRHLLVARGQLLISTPNRYLYSPTNSDGYHSRNPFHRREWTQQEFIALLSRYFPVVSVYGQIFVAKDRARIFHWRERIEEQLRRTLAKAELLAAVGHSVGLRCRSLLREPQDIGRPEVRRALHTPTVAAKRHDGGPPVLVPKGVWQQLGVRRFSRDEVPLYVVCLCQKE